MSLSKTTLWVAATAAVCVLAVVASWLLLIGPKRAEAAELRDQTTATEASNAALTLEIEELKSQFAELPQRQAELAAVKKAMPESPEIPTLVRELDAQAAANGVTLMSVTPSVAIALAGEGAPAPQPDPAAVPAEGEAAAPVAAPSGDTLAAVPVDVVVVGNFYNAKLFLKAVQTALSRDYLVQGLNVVAEEQAKAAQGGKPAVANGDVTMTITGSVFVLKPVSDPSSAAPGVTVPNAGPGVVDTTTN